MDVFINSAMITMLFTGACLRHILVKFNIETHKGIVMKNRKDIAKIPEPWRFITFLLSAILVFSSLYEINILLRSI
ncbi:hypothetical protein PIPA1_38890 [Pelosinus sp. IPA-1]|nr:hypothetical protein PIPA1_38890 [Pelosinus sp. IPA-1]